MKIYRSVGWSLFELLPDIVDSSVDDSGEAVDLCVAQIENGLAKADDIPCKIICSLYDQKIVILR